MRTRSKLALGGSFVSAATVGGLIVGGVFATTATLVVTDPLAPRASADTLSRFDSCRSLLDWYVQHAVKEVGPYGWNGRAMYALDDVVRGPADVAGVAPQPGQSAAESMAGSDPRLSAKSSTDARASSGTGTNTQEADVDEPDLAKTDGRRVVRLVDQRVVVISDVTGTEPRELGRVSLPVDAYGGELLLAGDHVLVTQSTPGGWGRPMPMPMPMTGIPEDAVGSSIKPGPGGTRVIDVDISDPARPVIAHDDGYTGQLVSMRLYGDTVRVVTTTDRPELPWAAPAPGKSGWSRSDEARATRHNRALVRATTIEDWLPAVTDNLASGRRSPLLDCQDVYHPADWSGSATTTVTTYDVGHPADRRSVGVTADGQVVYSSADRLYVTSTEVDPRSFWNRMDGSMAGREPMPLRPADVTTRLHAFALDDIDTRYVGSGHVTGSVRDRWSLDEHDGRLRVAWTQTGNNGHTQNGITVLAERGGSLVPTGRIDRLGLDENIQSVRWFDDFAVLVTFRQMDPLYTIDLTDQDHPREIGRLKIPGYSGYLHPIGDDLLLGLGVDATDQGRSLGAQAAVFDIRDLADPRRVSQQGFGPYSALPALDDPRGFTWLPDRRTGLTSVTGWDADRSRLVALRVSPSGALEARDLATDVGWNARTLPLDDGRVALVDEHGLRVLTVS